MRGLTLTLSGTPIILVLVILLTSSFPTQAQPRLRTITRAQIEEAVKRFKQPILTQFSPGDEIIEPREQKLERLLSCTRGGPEGCGQIRPMVIKELLLRLQIRDMGEGCTSDGNNNTALYGSPYRQFDFENNLITYQAWQDEILDTGLVFCDPVKHLICSPISKKCECRPGTVWKPEVDKYRCSVIAGGHCWIPGVDRRNDLRFLEAVQLYDPLTRDFVGITPIHGALCPPGGLNPEGRNLEGCTGGYSDVRFFLRHICVNDEIRRVDNEAVDYFNPLPRLNFGDSCNLEHQTQLFTTTEAEVKDYKIRVKKLEAILGAKAEFCDQNKLLICGSGGKCECIKPTIYNNESKFCTFKTPTELCQQETTFEKMAASLPRRVHEEILSGLIGVRGRECPLGCYEARFPIEENRYNPNQKRVYPPTKFCRPCPDSNGVIQVVGKNCDQSLTLILEGAPPPSLPIDIPDYDKQLELFAEFNEKAKEFEKLFRLKKNSPCAYAGELEAYRSIRRIKNVEVPDKVFTKQNYKDLMSSMDKLIGQFGGKGLCLYRLRGQPMISDFEVLPRNRPILLCGPTPEKPICYEPNNTVYLEELMNRLSGKSFQATNTSATCSPHPIDIVKYAGDQFGRYYFGGFEQFEEVISFEADEYLFPTLENHWIDNSQFCNRTGGFKCTKSADDKTNVTGKCEFSKDLFEIVEKERLSKLRNGSKSSHHSTQYLLPLLLFVLHIILLN